AWLLPSARTASSAQHSPAPRTTAFRADPSVSRARVAARTARAPPAATQTALQRRQRCGQRLGPGDDLAGVGDDAAQLHVERAGLAGGQVDVERVDVPAVLGADGDTR